MGRALGLAVSLTARVKQRGPPIEGADPRTFRGGANARDVVCHLRALLDDAEAALASS